MHRTSHNTGLTLVELMVAMIISSIILTAAATFAFVMDTATDAADDTGRKQAQLRYTTLRITELLRTSRLVCAQTSEDLVVWRDDDNEDGRINVNEIVYIESGAGQNKVSVCEFDSGMNPNVTLGELQLGATKSTLQAGHAWSRTDMIPTCSNVQIRLDATPPYSRLVSVAFDLPEYGQNRRYEVTGALLGSAVHLLNDAGDAIVSDDDL